MKSESKPPFRKRIVIAEDDDQKYEDITQIVVEAVSFQADVKRTSTARETERLCLMERPDLLLLDMSMNISPGGLGPMRGGFANLGGLEILEALRLSGAVCPTIVITAFDLFKATGAKTREYDIVGLEEINRVARERAGADFIDCIRYQTPDWENRLRGALLAWAAR